MKRSHKYLRRALLALAIFIAAVILAAAIFVRTSAFEWLLRDTAVKYLATTYRGQITLARIKGPAWKRLSLYDLAIDYKGEQVLSIPRLRVGYSLIPLLLGRIHLRLAAFDPVLHLRKEAGGEWNLLEAFSLRHPQPPGQSSTVYLDEIAIHNGRLDLTPSEALGKTYTFTALDMDGRADLLPSGVVVRLSKIETRASSPGMPQLEAKGSLTYQDARAPATLEVKVLRLATKHSQVVVRGAVRDFRTMDVDAAVSIEKLAALDLVTFFPGYPLHEELKGNLTVKGPYNAVHARLALTAGSVELSAQAKADLSRKQPKYDATLHVEQADLGKFFPHQDVAGTVDATIVADGQGAALSTISGEAKLDARDVALRGFRLGDLSFGGTLKDSRVSFSGKVGAAYGRASLSGTADVSRHPGYQLTFAIEHLNPEKVAGRRKWRGDINLRGTVRGIGIEPAKIKAAVELRPLRSTLGPMTLDGGLIEASVADGRVRITQGRIAGQGATLGVKGELGLSPGAPSALSYRLHTERLGPMLAVAHLAGEGRIDLEGQITGKLSDFRTRGTFRARELRLRDYAVRTADGEYDIAGIGQPTPYGSVSVTFGHLTAGIRLARLQAALKVQPTKPRRVRLTMEALDAQARKQTLDAEFSYEPGRVAGRLTDLAIRLPEEAWRLAQPAAFAWSPQGISVEGLSMRSPRSEILLDGTLSPAGEQNLALRIKQLNLAALSALIRPRAGLKGTVSVDVKIAGTAAAPVIALNADAKDLTVDSHRAGQLTASINYRSESALVNLELRQDSKHRLTAAGTLPLRLSWADGFKAGSTSGLDLRVRSPGLSLAFLKAFTGNSVQELEGSLLVDLTMRGSLWHPLPSGTLQLVDGQARIVPLSVQVSRVGMKVRIEPSELTIADLTAKAGEGSLSGNGTVALTNYSPGALKGRLEFKDWPAVSTRRYQAWIAGTLTAEGTPSAPRLQGRLDVLKATLRPDLSFLSDTAPMAPDRTITVIRPGERLTQAKQPPPKPVVSLFNRLALELTLVVHRDTWIKHDNANAELEGKLRITKEPPSPVAIVGTIQTLRGWVAFQRRRFNLVSGKISFTGGREIDPSLDINGQYPLPNYKVDVIVAGTAKKPSLKLTSDPPLGQADIVSLLLFGKTTSALGSRERTELKQQAAQLAEGYAAAQIGQAVSETLGLEGLGLGINGGGTNGTSVSFGRYLTRDAYVSASQEIAGTQGRKVSVQYYLTRWLSITTSAASDGSREIDIRLSKQY
jgi:translocation and assembly module TamB